MSANFSLDAFAAVLSGAELRNDCVICVDDMERSDGRYGQRESHCRRLEVSSRCSTCGDSQSEIANLISLCYHSHAMNNAAMQQ